MGAENRAVWDALRTALSTTRNAAPLRQSTSGSTLETTYAQEGIWLHERLFPDGGGFNTTLAVKLVGHVEEPALQASLESVVQRHEVLRTGFRASGGRPRPWVADALDVKIEKIDISRIPTAARADEMSRLAIERNDRPFDIGRPPLWRVALVGCDPDDHVLLWTVHHIVWDQSSYGVWLSEIAASYERWVSGGDARPPDLSIQLSDVAAWERREAASGRLAPHIEYWRTRLDGCAWMLELPRDQDRPPAPTFTGRSRWFEIGPDQRDAVAKLSRTNGTTPFMTMLAVFASLLQRYGNDREVVVGAPFSRRYRRELNPLVGPLVNLLMLRLDVSGDPTFAEVLRRVRTVVGEAYANQEAPYELVTETMEPDQTRRGGPRVQAMFTFYRMPPTTPIASGLEFRPMEADDGKARVDCELYIWESPEGMSGRFIFDADLFSGDAMTRICQHYRNLFAAVVVNPDRRLSELPLLTESERFKLMTEWNGGPATHGPEGHIHTVFENWARRTPDVAAVVDRDRLVSYADLDRRSNAVAQYLSSRGVGVGDLVAIHLERDSEVIVAMLAILKLGAAYVPLDLANPLDRTRLMLTDCGASVIITTADRGADLHFGAADVVLLEHLANLPEAPRGACSQLGRLAYVTYTSGSTGRPKGIAVRHDAVIDTVVDVDHLAIGPGDRVAQAANLSFDVATAEIWGALLNGATLVMLPHEVIIDPKVLARWLAEADIDSLYMTTSLFHRVAGEIPDAFSGLRDLLVGGEFLEAHWVAQVMTHGAPLRLVNAYGPTESTAYSTWHEVSTLPKESARIPIGRPIGRTRVYVLDASMKPVPIGSAGELYLGGPGLAEGYVGRPDLTAERFVPNPFAAGGGGRLYRTGDRVRFLADGDLEFIERIDNQVKIRGHRIELGEIEAALLLHPAIGECAVTVREVPARDSSPRDQRLVAHVVVSEATLPDVAELQRFLKRKLPSPMIPSLFESIPALPLTPSGKIDRLALSQRATHRLEPSREPIGPHNEVEQTLAGIWQRVLWLERDIGIHEDFFDLGGHSLLAAVLVAEVEEAFGLDLPLSAIFELTTISDLAGHLEPMVASLTKSLADELVGGDLVSAPGRAELPAEIYRRMVAFTAGWDGDRALGGDGLMVGLNLGGQSEPLFWCAQGFEEIRQLARYLGHDRPLFGMRSGHLAMRFSAENIRSLATHYVSEILDANPDGPYLIGGNCQGTYIAWEIARELRQRGRSVMLLALQLFDYRNALPYPGRVALFLGGDAVDRARRSSDEEPIWSELYPGGVTLDPISGVNRRHFVEPHIQDFARKLSLRIDQAVASEVPSVSAASRDGSLGMLILDMSEVRPSPVARAIRDIAGNDGSDSRKAVEDSLTKITSDFLSGVSPSSDGWVPLPKAVFRGDAAKIATAHFREVLADVADRTLWVLDDPRLVRAMPLVADVFPAASGLHVIHVVRPPADRVDSGLTEWTIRILAAEHATRNLPRSWVFGDVLGEAAPAELIARIEATIGPGSEIRERLAAGLMGEISGDGGALRAIDDRLPGGIERHPWATMVWNALRGFVAGREVESRVAMDALRHGLDWESQNAETDRILLEMDRLRKKSDRIWLERGEVERENDVIRTELECVRIELHRVQLEHEKAQQNLSGQLELMRQSHSWRITRPLRNLVARLRTILGTH
jgi:amino acid adenylation domain-containing protein